MVCRGNRYQGKSNGALHFGGHFSDGLVGEMDLLPELYGEVFEPLRDPAFFAQVRVDPELGTIVWPNGADFSPEYLYRRAKSTALA